MADTLHRERLFAALDGHSAQSLIWVAGPAGAGKTTLVADYLKARHRTCLWYQIDALDYDVSTFFRYVGRAAAAHANEASLPSAHADPSQDQVAFARRYFEALFVSLPPRSVLVLDDYHEIPDVARFHRVVAEGLVAAVPRGSTVIIVSRAQPPAIFSRIDLAGQIAHLGGPELALTRDETLELAKRRLFPTRGVEATALVEQIHTLTEGWFAGVALLLNHFEHDARPPEHLREVQQLEQYIAAHIFDALADDMRQFLLETSLLSAVTPALAERITGNSKARQNLAQLHREHFFVTRHDHDKTGSGPVYRYHPLLRQFLLQSAEQAFRPDELRARRLAAAALLLEAADIDEAAELLIAGCGWQALERLARREAPALLAQGQAAKLARWCDALLQHGQFGDGWIIYYRSAARVAVGEPGHAGNEANCGFESAFHQFCATRNGMSNSDASGVSMTAYAAGLRLCCAGGIAAVVQEGRDMGLMDPWVERLRELDSTGVDLPSVSPDMTQVLARSMALAIAFREAPPDIAKVNQVLALALRSGALTERLTTVAALHYHFAWTGDMGRLELLVRSIPVSTGDLAPLVRPIPHLVEAAHAWLAGDGDRCVLAVRAGLEVSRQMGITRWLEALLAYGVFGALSTNRIDDAEEFVTGLAQLAERGASVGRNFGLINHHFALAHVAARRSDWCAASAAIESAVEQTSQMRSPALLLFALHLQAAILFERGEAGWVKALARARAVAEQQANNHARYVVLLLEAHIAITRDQPKDARSPLAQAFAVGRACGIYSAWWPPAPGLARLCAEALEADIEPEYARQLIVSRRLMGYTPPLSCESWPWPIRVRALGVFAIECNGQPLLCSRKAQRVPLALVQAVIALGTRHDGARIDSLVDALWPDSDGDAGAHALETAVYRLRRLLGAEGAVIVRDGRLRLDSALCWVDVWAVEALGGGLEVARRQLEQVQFSPADTARRQAETLAMTSKLAALYRGPFLEDGAAWAAPYRQKLQSKLSCWLEPMMTS